MLGAIAGDIIGSVYEGFAFKRTDWLIRREIPRVRSRIPPSGIRRPIPLGVEDNTLHITLCVIEWIYDPIFQLRRTRSSF